MSHPDRRPGECRDEESRPSPSAGRRTLLVAMPAILSLRSGAAAAHARSSNVLVVAEFVPDDQDVLCVKLPWNFKKKDGKGYDLGDTPPTLEVTRIPSDRQFFRKYEKRRGQYAYAPVSRREMCEDGGKYYEYDTGTSYGSGGFDDELLLAADDSGAAGGEMQLAGGSGWFGEETDTFGGGGDKKWKSVYVEKGAMCSATALASFADVRIKDI